MSIRRALAITGCPGRAGFARLGIAVVIIPLLLAVVATPEPQKKLGHKPQPPAATASSAEKDREAIAALQTADITAAMAFDVDRMLELWTSDAALLPPHHEPVIGKAALRRFFENKKEQFANYEMLAYEEHWDEVMTTGNYAYQWGTISLRMKPPVGSEINGAIRAMRVLKRDEYGYWHIARAIWNEALPASK